MTPSPTRRTLAQYLHNVRTAFAVYQGNAYLCDEGALPIEVRQRAAGRLIKALRTTERLPRIAQ